MCMNMNMYMHMYMHMNMYILCACACTRDANTVRSMDIGYIEHAGMGACAPLAPLEIEPSVRRCALPQTPCARVRPSPAVDKRDRKLRRDHVSRLKTHA